MALSGRNNVSSYIAYWHKAAVRGCPSCIRFRVYLVSTCQFHRIPDTVSILDQMGEDNG
jgi:hypothetical protein